MADEASPELGEIRRKIRQTNNKIQDILQKYVSGTSKYLQEKILQFIFVNVSIGL